MSSAAVLVQCAVCGAMACHAGEAKVPFSRPLLLTTVIVIVALSGEGEEER